MQENDKIEEYVITDDFGDKKRGDWREKLSNFLTNKYFVPIVIVLVAIIGFSLGKISGLQEKRPSVKIISGSSGGVKGAATSSIVETSTSVPVTSGTVVASKNGTKYHYPWCAGAKQILPQNLVTFDSIESARAAGLTPASNCKGLK